MHLAKHKRCSETQFCDLQWNYGTGRRVPATCGTERGGFCFGSRPQPRGGATCYAPTKEHRKTAMGRWVVFMLRMNGHEGFFFGSGLRDGGIRSCWCCRERKPSRSAGEAGAVEGEAVEGAEDRDGDLLGLEILAGEGLELFASDGFDPGEDFVK